MLRQFVTDLRRDRSHEGISELHIDRVKIGFAALIASGVLLVFFAGLSSPPLLKEDGPGETMSAVLFLVAAIFGFTILLSKSSSTEPTRFWILCSVAPLALLFFLSEISFGARLFDIEMPPLEGGGQFDGGHDVLIVLVRMIAKGDVVSYFIGTVFVLILIALFFIAWKRRSDGAEILGHILRDDFYFRLMIVVLLLAGAVLLDLIPSYKAGQLEESLELFAALGLNLALLSESKSARKIAL